MADGRNYIEEARRILANESSLLPEKAHLFALDRQLHAMNKNIVVLAELLLAILADNDVPSMSIPASALAKVRQSRTMPTIQHQPNGAVVVRVVPLGDGGATMVAQPGKVM